MFVLGTAEGTGLPFTNSRRVGVERTTIGGGVVLKPVGGGPASTSSAT
jgi:hypothetical protein